MKRAATLVLDLVTKEVEAEDVYEYTILPHRSAFAARCEGDILESAEPLEAFAVENRIVPVNRICRMGRPDQFIIYSEEVEQLLGVPVRALVARADDAEARSSNLAAWRERALSLSWWKRLRILFQNNMNELV